MQNLEISVLARICVSGRGARERVPVNDTRTIPFEDGIIVLSGGAFVIVGVNGLRMAISKTQVGSEIVPSRSESRSGRKSTFAIFRESNGVGRLFALAPLEPEWAVRIHAVVKAIHEVAAIGDCRRNSGSSLNARTREERFHTGERRVALVVQIR